MRVLVGCECSGVIRDAFARRGHEAWSCDLQPSRVSGPHLQGDIRQFLRACQANNFKGWNLMICHPPCKYLSVSGMHWTSRGLRDPQLTVEAIEFAELLWRAEIPHIAIENPVSVLSTRSVLGAPKGERGQTIQPYQFGEDASKRTCLWLKGLPRLTGTMRIPGRLVEWPRGSGKMVERWENQTDSGQNRLGPSEEREHLRAKTYQGIADAMAEQWGESIL